jgi:hypothetical protein
MFRPLAIEIGAFVLIVPLRTQRDVSHEELASFNSFPRAPRVTAGKEIESSAWIRIENFDVAGDQRSRDL